MTYKDHFLVSRLVFSFLYTQNPEKNTVVSSFLSKIKEEGESNNREDHIKRKKKIFLKQHSYCWDLEWKTLKIPPLRFQDSFLVMKSEWLICQKKPWRGARPLHWARRRGLPAGLTAGAHWPTRSKRDSLPASKRTASSLGFILSPAVTGWLGLTC